MAKQLKLKWSDDPGPRDPDFWFARASRGIGGRYVIAKCEGWGTLTGYTGVIWFDVRRRLANGNSSCVSTAETLDEAKAVAQAHNDKLKAERMSKTYHGTRPAGTTYPGPVTVTQNGKAYPLKQYWQWTGFNWGYYGSGPGHLAYALLMDVLGDRDETAKFYGPFKEAVVSKLAHEWQLSEEQIYEWVRQCRDRLMSNEHRFAACPACGERA